jgi:alcohol dehydrogenase
MRQLTIAEDRKVDWQEVPEPTLGGPAEALVRPLAVALCDLDQPMIRGEVPIPGPIALGHECVAEVVEVGGEVERLRVGDRVVVPFQISCGECARCRAGLTNSCRAVQRGSMYGFGAFGGDWGGTLSDLVRVPFAEHMLVELPASIDPAAFASGSDNLPDAWRTVGPPLADRPGADVLIIGGGAPSIGLYAVGIAAALGAASVTYVDDDEQRTEVARRLGAETIDGPLERRYDRRPITVNATASHEGLHCALRSTEPDGVCTSVGIYYEETTPLPLLEMYTAGITFVTGRVQARPIIPEVLELVASGKLDPSLVTSRTAGWDDAVEAVQEPQRKLIITR